MRKFGFTLAEVLITLGIIGVVASMTIPALIGNTGQAEFKAGFKKAVSSLNQAVTMNVAVDSVDFSQLTSGACTSVGTICYMFNNRMNVVNIVSAADATLDPTGANPTMASTNNYALFFNNGSVFSFANTCNTPFLTPSNITNLCDAIIDVNGGKGPNRLTNCASSLTATTDSGTCTTGSIRIGDRYSVRFGSGVLTPNGNGARYALYN